MMQLYRAIAGCLGIGYLKGGGSIAAAITCIAWVLLQRETGSSGMMILVTVIIIAMGTWCAEKVESAWGKDSNKVVIDEVAGMCVSLLFVPITAEWVTVSFLLFRFFDILKPLYIRKTEKLPGGMGVMADDVLSGIYANLLVQLVRKLF